MVKTGLPILLEHMQKMFDTVLCSVLSPHTWKEGIAISIHKGADQTDPNNYRGITLTSVFEKVFCQILDKRISDYIEQNDDNERTGRFQNESQNYRSFFSFFFCIEKPD